MQCPSRVVRSACEHGLNSQQLLAAAAGERLSRKSLWGFKGTMATLQCLPEVKDAATESS